MAFFTSNRGEKKLDFEKWMSVCKGDELPIHSTKKSCRSLEQAGDKDGGGK
jgi:hypothetical protein